METLPASILDHLSEAVLVVAQSGSLVLSNRAAREMFGLCGQSALRLGDLLSESDQAELLAQRGKQAVRRVRARRHGGEHFLAEVSSGLDDDRLVLVVRDLSTHSQLDQQLARASQLEVCGRVASGVAHDLNGLLSVVGMSTHMLRNSSPDELPGLLEDLENAVGLGSALTTRLLSTARCSGEPREVMVNEALRGIVGLVRRSVCPKVRLGLELDPRAGLVLIDPVQLDQAILNLALNADRAMPEGGRLTIRSIVLDDEQAQGFVAVEVEDSGVGIAKSIQRRVFEPFFSTRSGAGGTGLGLSIVKDIVEQAGGLLEFETELGRGTRFRISLPHRNEVALARRSQISQEEFAIPNWGGGRSVLLVDDDELHRRSMARLIEAGGFSPLHARGAGEAMLIAERGQEPIVLAIVDLEMPYMDGRELGERLKQLRADLPVVLVSGSGRSIAADSRIADATLSKPLRPELLFDTLTRLLPRLASSS